MSPAVRRTLFFAMAGVGIALSVIGIHATYQDALAGGSETPVLDAVRGKTDGYQPQPLGDEIPTATSPMSAHVETPNRNQ